VSRLRSTRTGLGDRVAGGAGAGFAMAAALLLVVPGVAAAAPASRAGDYDGGQTEMAARLRLLPDGRFQYALSYGALDEFAKGRWREEGGRVLLTTEPAPKPPHFAVVSDTATKDGRLYATLSDPELMQGAPLTLAVTYEGADRPVFVEAEENGRVPLDPGRRAVAIVPDLPVFPQPLAAHPLGPGGRRIVFRFEPNDLGVAAFRDEPLEVAGDALVLRRWDRVIRFRKE
jgi:hypothetical protein